MIKLSSDEGVFWRARYGRPDPMRDPDGYMRWLVGEPSGGDDLRPLSFPMIDDAYTIGPSAAPAEKRWFVVVTEPQKERSVCDDLARDGIESFVPKLKLFKRRRVNDIASIVYERPLLPRYVFAGATEAAGGILRVMDYRHAFDVLRRSGEPAAIPTKEIESLRHREEAGEFDKTGPPLWIVEGIGIKVTDGPFASFGGTVDKVDRVRRRVRAEVMIFGRMTRVDLRIGQFEAA